MPEKQIEHHEYDAFRHFLEKRCGIVLGENKQYLVRSRLSPLLKRHQFATMSALVEQVVNGYNHLLQNEVIDAMTTNETLWFRDNYPYQILNNELFPKLSLSSRPVKIWSAACSSGQEPYSIAMTALEYSQANMGKLQNKVQIIGTDISSDMLKCCQMAEYDSLSLSRGLSEERKRQFFETSTNGMMRIKADVKRMVHFQSINLLEPYRGLGPFDIVFCRNVLIYFSAEVKRKILQQIADVMQPEAVLFLGASESISGVSDQFRMVRTGSGLYYVKK